MGMSQVFEEELAKEQTQLQVQNNITDSVFTAIQDAIVEGKFIIKDGGSVAMGENPNTKKLSIIFWMDDVEFEMRIKPSDDWDNM